MKLYCVCGGFGEAAVLLAALVKWLRSRSLKAA